MNDFDVASFEMDDNSLSDTDIEAVLDGDQTTGPEELHALLGGLRERFETSTDVPVGAALAEFIEVVDLTTTTDQHVGPRKKRKVITGIGTFIATTTGKIALGTAVAAASVGGVHAADLVDVPGLPETSAEVVVVDETEVSGESFDEVVLDDLQEKEAVEDEFAEDSDVEDEIVDDGEVEDEQETKDDAEVEDEDDEVEADDDEDEPKNHGQVVSDFAHTTELEGCEKGQAISALASSKAKGNTKVGDDGEVDANAELDANAEVDASVEVDDVDSDSPCKNHDSDESDDADESDDDSDDDDSDDDDSDDDDSDDKSHGNGNGKAKGKNNKADDEG